jgi:hypothetical protein
MLSFSRDATQVMKQSKHRWVGHVAQIVTKTLKERENLGDLNVDGKVILKYKKIRRKLWNVFIWFGI